MRWYREIDRWGSVRGKWHLVDERNSSDGILPACHSTGVIFPGHPLNRVRLEQPTRILPGLAIATPGRSSGGLCSYCLRRAARNMGARQQSVPTS